jgi:predicted transcriptional regulator
MADPIRPANPDEVMVQLGIKIPESVDKQLRAVAEERDVSRNRLIQRAIVEYLGRLKPAVEVLASE